ncbi:hypothetical protein B0H99_102231 [Planomicrobium soli]|uniref:Yip1-like protein n=2 Tax=Planomicrobium soli TaxID=1176648 RepID=A0A2P8H5P2_9BACL|nr:hypothetical protein B0H99_102231 [Planomicrobium soli]
MVGKMIALDEPSFRSFLDSPKTEGASNLLLLATGVGYGAISIASNASYILSFDSTLLKVFIIPLVFLFFGLLMAFVTKIGLALLLWAGAKGLGGTGQLRAINLAVPAALIPGLLAVPYLAGAGKENGFVLLLLLGGVVWMYLVSARIIQATQNFTTKKSYFAAFLSFLFLASVYYLITPTG